MKSTIFYFLFLAFICSVLTSASVIALIHWPNKQLIAIMAVSAFVISLILIVGCLPAFLNINNDFSGNIVLSFLSFFLIPGAVAAAMLLETDNSRELGFYRIIIGCFFLTLTAFFFLFRRGLKRN